MRVSRTTGPAALLLALLLVAIGTAEAQRPMFHVRPPANWINDPNGPYRDPITGKMHLYMQYNPFSSVWGEMHWYHFTSDDYVTWHDESVALRNNHWYDHWGVYSGSITHNPVDGTPVLMYTCVSDLDVQRQCIAVPPREDIRGSNAPRALNTFAKSAQNPVLTERDVPDLVGLGNFRDPTNFWKNPDNESEWLVAFVARIKTDALGDHGHVVVFKTADPTWRSGFTYSHSLWHEEHDFHRMMECPDFFQLGSEYFMKVSTMISQQDIWVYGSYNTKNKEGNTVYVEDEARTPTYIDYGRWYASKQNYDPVLNRTILWGWIVEEISDDDMRKQGWSGMMDMPRYVEYDEKAKKLKTYPMPELEKLRMEPLVKDKKIDLAAEGNPAEVTGVAGRHYELVVDFTLPEGAMEKGEYDPSKEPSFGVDVLGSADGKRYTRIAVAMPSKVDPKKDLNGKQYRTMNVKDENECAARCEEERRCVGWTSARSDNSINCALQSTVGISPERGNDTTTSGRASDPVLLVDRTNSGTTGSTETWVGRAPVNGNKVQLRVFVDGTAVQVFKDGGLESLSTRVYEGNKELTYVSVFALNIKGTVNAVATLYPMDSVYAARMLDVEGEKPEAGGEKPEAGGEKPEAGGEKPEAGGKKPEAGGEKPEAGGKKPEAGGEKPATRNASGAPVRCGVVLLLAVLVQALL